MNRGELSFCTVAEVRATAAFHRRMGDVAATDERALEEALEEVLASNDALREKLNDAEDGEDPRLDCGIADADRDAGEDCEGKDIGCAACRVSALLRKLVEVRGSKSARAEVETLRSSLEFVTAERNALLLEVQRGVAPAKAPSRGRKAPPADQIGLFAKLVPSEAPKPAEKKPRAKREKKKRRWLDAKVEPKAKRVRKAVSK